MRTFVIKSDSFWRSYKSPRSWTTCLTFVSTLGCSLFDFFATQVLGNPTKKSLYWSGQINFTVFFSTHFTPSQFSFVYRCTSRFRLHFGWWTVRSSSTRSLPLLVYVSKTHPFSDRVLRLFFSSFRGVDPDLSVRPPSSIPEGPVPFLLFHDPSVPPKITPSQ